MRGGKRAFLLTMIGLLAAATLAPVTAAAAPGDGPAAPLQDAVDAFDAARAYAHVEAMVDMGPRPLGSEALERNRRYIEEHLRAVGLEPWRDEFVAATPHGEVPMANIVATVAPAGGEDPAAPRIVLASHFDTKLFEGLDFVGANDGASSTGVLLELARVLAEHRPGLPVDLVFFDGEEAVVRWSEADSTYGSRNLVNRWFLEGRLERLGAMILLDMVGDADLQIEREINSTHWINDIVWEAAAGLGYAQHFPGTSHAIMDDHLPFIDAGVDAVDLIDFDYGPGNRYWHSPHDTLDKISAESLGVAGRVVLASLPAIEARLRQSRS